MQLISWLYGAYEAALTRNSMYVARVHMQSEFLHTCMGPGGVIRYMEYLLGKMSRNSIA